MFTKEFIFRCFQQREQRKKIICLLQFRPDYAPEKAPLCFCLKGLYFISRYIYKEKNN